MHVRVANATELFTEHKINNHKSNIAHYEVHYVEYRRILLRASETEAHCGGPQTELGRQLLSWSYSLFQGFQYALIPPTYNNKKIHFCLQLFLLELMKGLLGVELLLACLTVSVFNQISERGGETESWVLAGFVVSDPFLEKPPSYRVH